MSAELAARIFAATEEILRSFDPNSPSFKQSAVNWGDLHCTCVLIGVEYYGDPSQFPPEPFIRVEIEEAAPDNYDLGVAVNRELEKRGFPNVDVRMEW